MDVLAAEVRGLLDELVRTGEAPQVDAMSIDEMRQAACVTLTRAFLARSGSVPQGLWVADTTTAASGAQVKLRLYRPLSVTRPTVLLRIHGGGWTMGSVRWLPFEALSRDIALRTGCVVVDVEYRLAPEHRYPAGLEDCYAALCWIDENAQRLGVDPAKVVLCGDSAGGTLAAGLSLLARDRGGPTIAGQVLEVPCPDLANVESYASAATYGSGFGLTTEDLVRTRDLYFLDPQQAQEAYASPALAADLSDYPRTFVLTAEHDPVRDVGEQFVDRLRRAGVQAASWRGDGHIHMSPMLLYPSWKPARAWRARLVSAVQELWS